MKGTVERIGRSVGRQPALLLTAAGLVLTVVTLVAVPLAWTINTPTFSGEIQDSSCAGTAVHVEKECALTCVRKGAKWVLFDPSKENIYQLDDQETSGKFAAQWVRITGRLNKSTKMIHVVKIKSL